MINRESIPTADSSVPPTLPGGASNAHSGHNIKPKLKRKKTFSSLLDTLEEFTSSLRNQQASFEDDRDVPTIDEHIQVEGAAAFNRFQSRIINLDRELRNFANAAGQLRSSVGIISSFHLRERLAQVLFLFHNNAAELFPRKVMHQPRGALLQSQETYTRETKHYKVPPTASPTQEHDNLHPSQIPEQLRSFASDTLEFLDCLNEFPEFIDEGVNSSFLSLEGDLQYWASCLDAYEGQFRNPAVQRYLHDLTIEMGEHLDGVAQSLSIFIKIGVPAIQFAQQHAASNLLNISTLATFFSAVTATTMQFTVTGSHDTLSDAVNGFWFTSLVFSIAAAVNSLLGLTWKQALYRSPDNRVPWWVMIWIKRSPLVFLVLSVACFSMGLVLFSYSSNQHRITSTLTTVISAISSSGLMAVSMWFAAERYIYSRHKGKKWLSDILSDTNCRIKTLPHAIGSWFVLEPQVAARNVAHWGKYRLSGMRESTVAFWREHVRRISGREVEASRQASLINVLPVAAPTSEPLPMASVRHHPSQLTLRQFSDVASTTEMSLDGADERIDGCCAGIEVPRGRTRFVQAVRSIIRQSSPMPTGRPTSPLCILYAPKRQRTTSVDDDRFTRSLEAHPAWTHGSRVATLVPKLRSLRVTHESAAHQALVRHVQFSPNGKFLATSSWDRTSVIFQVGEQFTPHRILAHPQGVVTRMAWSPSGTTLITKVNRGTIQVWTQDGVCRHVVRRPPIVQSIAWLRGGEAFLSVENSDIVKLDTAGGKIETYHFERMIMHDAVVTEDSQRLLCVGTLMASHSNLHPKKSRAEKQIIAYNLDKKAIECRVPALHEVRHIILAQDGQAALVSYENKAPPQLWKMEIMNDTARLSLRHTYMPKDSVDFAGPSQFAGKHDELVFCAGKAGDIYIWHRESATLLHHIRAQALGGDLTCFAWNHTVDSFMFATGSHDGALRIWATPDRDGQSHDHPALTGKILYGKAQRTSSPHSFEESTIT